MQWYWKCDDGDRDKIPESDDVKHCQHNGAWYISYPENVAAQFEVKYQSFQEAIGTVDVAIGAGDVELSLKGGGSEAEWVTVDMEGRIAHVTLGERPQGRVYSVKVVEPFRQRNVTTGFKRDVIRLDSGPKIRDVKKGPKKKTDGSEVTLLEDEDTDKLIQYVFDGDHVDELPGFTYLTIPKFPADLLGDKATRTGTGDDDPGEQEAEQKVGELEVSGLVSMEDTKHQILLVKKGQLIQVSKKRDEDGWWYGTVVYDHDEVENMKELKVEILLCYSGPTLISIRLSRCSDVRSPPPMRRSKAFSNPSTNNTRSRNSSPGTRQPPTISP